jgi:hypothetical protein
MGVRCYEQMRLNTFSLNVSGPWACHELRWADREPTCSVDQGLTHQKIVAETCSALAADNDDFRLQNMSTFILNWTSMDC